MTAGSIRKHLIFFAFPIFLGRLLQQLYHTTDAVVVELRLRQALLNGQLGWIADNVDRRLAKRVFVGSGVVISSAFGQGDPIQ